MTQRQFLLASVAIVLLAWYVRESFVLAMYVTRPIAGDAAEYVRYAMNLPTFGKVAGIPDAYRSPGYPLFLRALMGGDWFARVYQAQALLGAATVACMIALGRQWLPRGWALAAGLWMALQAHHVAATGTILSEVLFGFLLVAGLLCAALALDRPKLAWGAGTVLGMAYLTNPVAAFVPLLLVPVFWRERQLRTGVVIALVAGLAIGGWAIRNVASQAGGDHRAAMNFVQGSHPEYHEAWKYQRLLMHDAYGAINAEVDTIKQDREAGVREVMARMAEDPARYAGWYVRKVFLLWDWNIRIGQGGIYTVRDETGSLDRGWFAGATAVQIGLNALLFWLALLGIGLAWRNPAALMVAIAVVYVTAVHVVLQAEPRYAIPYRGLEVLLAFTAVAQLASLRLRQPQPVSALS